MWEKIGPCVLRGTRGQKLKYVALQCKFGVYDDSANADERLHVAQLYPTAIFIKPQSMDSILEMNKRLTDDQTRKTFEQAMKLEQVEDVIQKQSGDTIWVPSKEKKV